MTARARGRDGAAAWAGSRNVPGLSYIPALLLHGEQDVEIHRPLPTAAELTTRGRVAEIWDKGKAALVVSSTPRATRRARCSPTGCRCSCAARAASAARRAAPGNERRARAPTARWIRSRCRSRRCSTG